MNSLFLRINFADVGKGLLVAVFSAVLMFLYNLLQTQGLAFSGENLQELLKVALITLIGYLSKNFLTNSDNQFGKKENTEIK